MPSIPRWRSEKKVPKIFVAVVLFLLPTTSTSTPTPAASSESEVRRSNVGRSPKVPLALNQPIEISDALFSKLVDRLAHRRLGPILRISGVE